MPLWGLSRKLSQCEEVSIEVRVKQYRHQIQPDKPSCDKDEELKQLRKETQILRSERDLLKKTAVNSMNNTTTSGFYAWLKEPLSTKGKR